MKTENTTRTLPAYRVHRDDGTSYVTSMAIGITLEMARDYFLGHVTEEGHTIIRVTDASEEGGAS